ncbi:hypothetical protein [Streptomyces rapamycinicus]|uniref:Uncharacterized protein n=1 Tax=Streptomyces rapamycinicus TaxID=1226757 RepID=A0ABR6LWA1_9ACTN|nr:hypothetical protein [Streptomyces rapamycinicus]MBB4785853.1 hypothetical protein [Streptomyces rapamycinicus]UTO66000.1 hypothetical protein LJB45_29205 [Streptomyces rapamycinicus]UTP33954.1 hypothetical protein LIV37_34335 [Streptomyces rapamycinicus NRRL 5491]
MPATATDGLIVNGDDVTMYGLFDEHYQHYQTIWNGNGGAGPTSARSIRSAPGFSPVMKRIFGPL